MGCLMSCIQKFLPLLILSFLSTPVFAVDEELLKSSLTDIIAIKDHCHNQGSGFHYHDPLTVISVNHVTISKECGELKTLVIGFLTEGRRDIGVKRAIAAKDGPILIDKVVLDMSYEGEQKFLSKMASVVHRGEKVYVPVYDFLNGDKSVQPAKITAFVKRIRVGDDFGIHTYRNLLTVSPTTGEGSSGSPVVNENNEIVGVIVAGNKKVSYAFPVEGLEFKEPRKD